MPSWPLLPISTPYGDGLIEQSVYIVVAETSDFQQDMDLISRPGDGVDGERAWRGP